MVLAKIGYIWLPIKFLVDLHNTTQSPPRYVSCHHNLPFGLSSQPRGETLGLDLTGINTWGEASEAMDIILGCSNLILDLSRPLELLVVSVQRASDTSTLLLTFTLRGRPRPRFTVVSGRFCCIPSEWSVEGWKEFSCAKLVLPPKWATNQKVLVSDPFGFI